METDNALIDFDDTPTAVMIAILCLALSIFAVVLVIDLGNINITIFSPGEFLIVINNRGVFLIP